MQFLLPRMVVAAGQKEYESSLLLCYLTFPLILAHLVYHLLFLLSLRGTASLRLELPFTMGSVQHAGVLTYLRPLGTSTNKQHMLIGLQFQSTSMNQELRQALESQTERKNIFYRGEAMSIQTAFLRN